MPTESTPRGRPLPAKHRHAEGMRRTRGATCGRASWARAEEHLTTASLLGRLTRKPRECSITTETNYASDVKEYLSDMMLECSSVPASSRRFSASPHSQYRAHCSACLPWTPQCTLSGPSLPAGRSGRLPLCPPFPPANGKALGGRRTLCRRPVSGLTVWLVPTTQRHSAARPPRGWARLLSLRA